MANHRHNKSGRFESELDIDHYISQPTIDRASKLAWLKRAARAGGGYVELMTAHPYKLDALMNVERERRELVELMRADDDGSRPTIDPAPSSVRAGRVLVTQPMRVRRNTAFIAANGATIPVEPAPEREVKLDVRYDHRATARMNELTSSGYDFTCYVIDADGNRKPFDAPSVERDSTRRRANRPAVDAASSYAARVERYGANVELAAE